MARVVFSRSSWEQLAALDARVVEAVLDAVTALEGDPGMGKRLRGHLVGLWSLRIGSYRLVYEVRNRRKTVRVVSIFHRRLAYRSDPR